MSQTWPLRSRDSINSLGDGGLSGTISITVNGEIQERIHLDKYPAVSKTSKMLKQWDRDGLFQHSGDPNVPMY